MDLKVALAIQEIKSAKYSLIAIQKLQENGFDFSELNASSLAGELVCRIVSRNYGLGLQLLTECGIRLDCVDPSDGSTPLIVLAAEGLCSPTRYLLERVPLDHLCHATNNDTSALSLLLARGHAECGCLEACLRRLLPQSSTSPTTSATKTVLGVPELLRRVRTTNLDRVAAVFDLWIAANLIDLSIGRRERAVCARLLDTPAILGAGGMEVNLPVLLRSALLGRDLDHQLPEFDEEFAADIKRRTVGVVVTDCRRLETTIGPPPVAAASKCIQILAKLLALGCIEVDLLRACLDELSATQAHDQLYHHPHGPLDPFQARHLEKGLRRLVDVFGPITPLRVLCIQGVRRQLQKAQLSHSILEHHSTELNALVFQRQLNQLDLPTHAQEMLLLQNISRIY